MAKKGQTRDFSNFYTGGNKFFEGDNGELFCAMHLN